MDWSILLVVLIVLLFFLLFIGQKVAFALGTASLIGFMMIQDWAGMQMVGNAIWNKTTSLDLSALPLYIFMGEIVVVGGLSKRFYDSAGAFFARIPGGFLQNNIFCCSIFAAITGSSVACAASIGSVSYEAMKDLKYDKKMTLGTLGGAGALGILIPPSGGLLIYGAITQTSVAQLFIAGIVPGVLCAIIFMIYVGIRCKVDKKLIPALPPKTTAAQKLRAIPGMLPFILLIGMILGTIYFGVCTPTEAAAFSCFLAFGFVLLVNRGKVNWRLFLEAGRRTVSSTCFIFFVILGAQLFSALISRAGISKGLASWFAGSGISSGEFFFIFILIYVILGMLMDGTSILYLTMPVLFPLCQMLGWDPIWLGVICIILIEIALLTPPVGFNLFVLLGITHGDASFKDVIVGCIPYIFLYGSMLALLWFLPQIATWLPSTMY